MPPPKRQGIYVKTAPDPDDGRSPPDGPRADPTGPAPGVRAPPPLEPIACTYTVFKLSSTWMREKAPPHYTSGDGKPTGKGAAGCANTTNPKLRYGLGV